MNFVGRLRALSHSRPNRRSRQRERLARYRNVDIEDLVGRVSFGHIWGLLVDAGVQRFAARCNHSRSPSHSGDIPR